MINKDSIKVTLTGAERAFIARSIEKIPEDARHTYELKLLRKVSKNPQ